MGTRMERSTAFEAIVVVALIFLCAVLFAGIAVGPSGGSGNWSTSSVNATQFMYSGSNDRLYLFEYTYNGTEIHAIGKDGITGWSLNIPLPWQAICSWERRPQLVTNSFNESQLCTMSDTRPVFASQGDTLFLYTWKGSYYNTDPYGYYSSGDVAEEKVVAISGGRKLWERQLDGIRLVSGNQRDAWLEARGDRLYVYHSYKLEVMGTNGTHLFIISDVSDPPAIGDDGRIYVTKACRPQQPELYGLGQGFMVPSGTVEAYYPNGTLCWRAETNITPARQAIDRTLAPECAALPLYNNGTLYLPMLDGIAAMDTEGRVEWIAHLGQNVAMLPEMPFGPDGYAYLTQETEYAWPRNYSAAIFRVGPGGSNSAAVLNQSGMCLIGAGAGIGYFMEQGYSGVPDWNVEDNMPGLNSFLDVNLTAIDLRTGAKLWARSIGPARVETTVVDRANVMTLFMGQVTGYNTIAYSEDHPGLERESGLEMAIMGTSVVNFVQGRDVNYVGYYLYNYEHPAGIWAGQPYMSAYKPLFQYYGCLNPAAPALLNRSRIAYFSGIEAIDRNGTILWNRPADSMLTGLAAGNGTIYYGTRGGGLSAIRTSVAVNFTISAAIYLFLRFFLVGAVARARNRLENNENRNRTLKFIKEAPGSTMYEIARALGINAGTVRYHLFILAANHRVAIYKDGKYLRYFTNSHAYTPEERAIIALLRRDSVRSLLNTLYESHGMSNAELSRALNVTEPAVSSYLRELTAKGMVSRATMTDGKILYTIRKELREHIATGLGMIKHTVDDK